MKCPTRPAESLFLGALTVALALTAGAAGAAERHALLIGIGEYPELYRLAGPGNDVEALARELVDHWGFRPENVHRLLDGEATKRAILDAVDRLTLDTRPGDDVFLYYSGHGTSAFDEELAERVGDGHLGKWTGALMPYDYATDLPKDPTPEEWVAGLIVGERDLKPRLSRLDRDRNVFVVFDTCFSGSAVRSISERPVRWVSPPPLGKTRGIDFADDPFEGPVFGTATARQERYPYRKLIYLAAAGKKERAEEVSARLAIDRRPHGALTHSLLKALSGQADANRDRRLTYVEVFEFVRRDVYEHHQQMPQLLYPEDAAWRIRQPLFDVDPRLPGSNTPSAAGSGPIGGGSTSELRVRLAPDLAHLGRRVEALPHVRLSRGGEDYHVRLERESDGLVALYHPSGDRIAGGFSDLSPARLLERIERQVGLRSLVELTYPRQDFSVALDLPRGKGFLYRGEEFEITARADRPAVFLLLNVDKSGTVSVLYPIGASELRPKTVVTDEFEVIPPYGTEYLKLFAFRRAPERLDSWMNQKIDALDPRFGELLELLRNPGVERAETRLKVVTVGELIRDER